MNEHFEVRHEQCGKRPHMTFRHEDGGRGKAAPNIFQPKVKALHQLVRLEFQVLFLRPFFDLKFYESIACTSKTEETIEGMLLSVSVLPHRNSKSKKSQREPIHGMFEGQTMIC